MTDLAIEYLPLTDLVPYARNARTHSAAQVSQIAASVREFGWTNPVLVDDIGGIIAGHGRVMAAQLLGMDQVPCIRLLGLTKTQQRAYALADNRLALNAGWDAEMLAVELDELRDDGFNLSLLGFESEELNELIGTPNIKEEIGYTRKIETPVYTPKGTKPAVEELFNREKADALLEQIAKADLTPDERLFLTLAAARHVVFDYHNIAEFYCHAPQHVQALMEDSALVIIDFDKAIENGYVQLSQKLASIYDDTQPGSDLEEDDD